MNEESLRAHLVELEAKGMNTRGVLRKLLQQYCRDGNLKAAREIATKCQNEGVSQCYSIKKTATTKCIIHSHLKNSQNG